MTKINVVHNNDVSFPKFVVGNLPHPNLQNKAEILNQVQDDLMGNVKFTPDLPITTTTACVEDPYTPSPRCIRTRPSPSRERAKERVLALNPSWERGNKQSPSPAGEKVRETGMRGKGFTLIELLVVVLIIGILAAVALPQYQKAVITARLTGALPVFNALVKGAQLYYLANGEWPTTLDKLDIEIPGNSLSNDNFSCAYMSSTPSIMCHVKINSEQRNIGLRYFYVLPEPYCFAAKGNNFYDRVCQSFSSNTRPSSFEGDLIYYKMKK